jgi:P2-related tail formation protein|tara:strand:+ start:650 stop:844 length:195 start_codon:yes stop_codon:yes gene_type:complete
MRKITLKTKGLSQKQYSTLVLELDLVSKSWKKFGVEINIEAEGVDRIISWGNKTNDDIRSEARD